MKARVQSGFIGNKSCTADSSCSDPSNPGQNFGQKGIMEMEAVLRENLVLYREAQLEMRAVLQSFLVLNRMASLVMKVVLEAVLATTWLASLVMEAARCRH